MKNGTEKQIAWAESIKAGIIKACELGLADARNDMAANLAGGEDRPEWIERMNARVACWEARLATVHAMDDAKAIIDGRNKPWADGHDAYGRPLRRA